MTTNIFKCFHHLQGCQRFWATNFQHLVLGSRIIYTPCGECSYIFIRNEAYWTVSRTWDQYLVLGKVKSKHWAEPDFHEKTALQDRVVHPAIFHGLLCGSFGYC